jgi:polysaccharide pyruvyl transferase WcaK-like protein
MLAWQFCKRALGHEFVFERFIKQSDYVFALGGDNYTLDYANPEAYFRANELVHQRNKPVVMWGCSVGPFSARPEFEKYAAAELKKVHKIVVRETETQAYLDSIGVSENVILRPDPAFFLEPQACPLPDKVEKFLTQGCIGLNLSPLLGRYREDNWALVAGEWLEELLKTTDLPVLLIPHVMQPGNDDHEFMKGILQMVSSPERVALVAGDLSSREYKYVISRLKVFAGARTHATIAAFSTGTPTFSIGYSLKSRGINQDLFGHLNWLEDHRKLTASAFAGKVTELLQSEAAVRAHLGGAIAGYKKCPIDFLTN